MRPCGLLIDCFGAHHSSGRRRLEIAHARVLADKKRKQVKADIEKLAKLTRNQEAIIAARRKHILRNAAKADEIREAISKRQKELQLARRSPEAPEGRPSSSATNAVSLYPCLLSPALLTYICARSPPYRPPFRRGHPTMACFPLWGVVVFALPGPLCR